MAKTTRKKARNLQITERDYKLLRYLWKWKVLSTSAIAKKFFPEAKSVSAYIRLLRLEKAGFIESIPIDKRHFDVWAITAKGFRVIQSQLVDLAHQGFKSENPYHDYIATAFHLGEWLTNRPPYGKMFSEQQQRRIH